MLDFLFSKRIMHVVHGPCEIGDIKPLDADTAARYVKHGWGEIVTPPPVKKTAVKKTAAKVDD